MHRRGWVAAIGWTAGAEHAEVPALVAVHELRAVRRPPMDGRPVRAVKYAYSVFSEATPLNECEMAAVVKITCVSIS